MQCKMHIFCNQCPWNGNGWPLALRIGVKCSRGLVTRDWGLVLGILRAVGWYSGGILIPEHALRRNSRIWEVPVFFSCVTRQNYRKFWCLMAKLALCKNSMISQIAACAKCTIWMPEPVPRKNNIQQYTFWKLDLWVIWQGQTLAMFHSCCLNLHRAENMIFEISAFFSCLKRKNSREFWFLMSEPCTAQEQYMFWIICCSSSFPTRQNHMMFYFEAGEEMKRWNTVRCAVTCMLRR